ncbi:MAG: hypothetical protein J0I54_20610 [Bosea sp.]|uniref:hypothetical protein n=1 Tax=unclassified Bosea (in: a-proteobacteria) TaxID=2653178 RepID=UPI000961211D|nr:MULTISPECIES: hypothetical protein [unclassified Bosea (in: a-proteobacteria)]MBN9459042.1 hypothetical protein [Bosea sp. (in: a-proteobacteria)]OJV06216.1 MAG: hypothetical protein BGO20_08140 [Bosea sp. 67-29]
MYDASEGGMIIRRRRTRNFTILENEVLDDERLSLAAMGLLAWLRSRPSDWSLSVEHLRGRFKVGRDKMHELVRELVEAGWITRERKRDEVTKAYCGIEYVVLDEASPPSAGVSEAEPHPENQDVAQPHEGDLFPECSEPHPALPHPANPDAYIRTENNQELSHTPLPPLLAAAKEGVCAPSSVLDACGYVIAEPPRPPARFDEIAEAWPWEDGESRIQAEAAFQRLVETDRRHAVAAAGAYVRSRERGGRKRSHLKTYLSDRLFLDFPSDSTTSLPAKQVFIAIGTPEFAAWDRAYREAGKPGMPSASRHEGRSGWWRPTRFPPSGWRPETMPRTRDGPAAA